MIGVFVAYVAFQQWRTNRASLREKLFDRRLQIFEEIDGFFSMLLQEGCCNDDAIKAIWSAPLKAKFLFGKDLQKYLENIKTVALRANHYGKLANNTDDPEEQQQAIDSEDFAMNWLIRESKKKYEKFLPYLNFKGF